jgi:hypothetical protein
MRIGFPSSSEQVWSVAWTEAVERPEIARDLRRAGLDPAPDGPLARDCRRDLLPRVRSEATALAAATRDRRVGTTSVTGLSLFLVVVAIVEPVDLLFTPSELVGPFPAWVWLTGAFGSLFAAGVRFTTAALERERQAQAELQSALASLLVPYLRRAVNARLRVSFATLEVRDATGLSETVDPSLEVATNARAQLTALMRHMRSGAIGVSGSRGAGKSTLIRAACGGRLTPSGRASTIGVTVAAPVRWEASEFVPLLFAELCTAVAPATREGEQTRNPVRTVLAVYTVLLLVVGLGALVVGVANGTLTIRSQQLQAAAIALAGLAVLVAAFRWILGWPDAARGSPVPGVRRVRRRSLRAEAERCLRELRFRETVVHGWSLGARAPLGLALGGKRELTAIQQPLTLAEVVAR